MSDMTKQDLTDMAKRLDETARESENRIVNTLKAHVTESCCAVETKLLRAFHGWARSMEVRVRTGA